MKRLFLFLAFLPFFATSLSAQNEFTIEQSLYEGTIDGEYNITLFLSVEDPCGGNPYTAGMYKYKDDEEWIELSISFNEEEERYCMAEYLFTGVLILKKENSSLNGRWISPDAERQIPVKLRKKTLSASEKESYTEILNNLFYNHNDC